MRTSVIVLALAAICLISGQSPAMTVKPYIDPVYLMDYGGTMSLGWCWIVAIEIQMDNPDPPRGTISLPLRFYGTDGLTSWGLVDKGGDIVPNIVMKNGFEHDPFPNPWFPIIDTIFLFNWDGMLADTVNFTASGVPGMPSGEPLLTRLEFWFIIKGEGTFCVDSCSIPNTFPPGKFNWLFDNPYPSFGGPYCWPVRIPNCGPPGDLNDDLHVNILDVTYLINYLYRDGPRPMFGADLDCSGQTNILDVTHLVNYLYKDGPDPAGC